MAKYKNLGITSRTFYGIEIKPGEVKEFPGFINASRCIRVSDDTPTTRDICNSINNIHQSVVQAQIGSDDRKTEDSKTEDSKTEEKKSDNKDDKKSAKSTSIQTKVDSSKSSGK